MSLWESVKVLICFCELIDFVHLSYFFQKLLQAPSDVIRTCAYMYTVSRENASLCEKFDVYIDNVGGNNVKGKWQM